MPTCHKRKQTGDAYGKRPLIEAMLAYAVFCALGWSSRYLPAMFFLFVLFGLLFPLAWAAFHRDWKAIGFTQNNTCKALLWGLLFGLAWVVYTFLGFRSDGAASSLPLTSPAGVASTFVLGILMGYLYQRWGDILSPWLAHAIAGMGLVLIGRMVFIQVLP